MGELLFVLLIIMIPLVVLVWVFKLRGDVSKLRVAVAQMMVQVYADQMRNIVSQLQAEIQPEQIQELRKLLDGMNALASQGSKEESDSKNLSHELLLTETVRFYFANPKFKKKMSRPLKSIIESELKKAKIWPPPWLA